MTNKFLLNRSGMSPEVTCRKGRHAIGSILSRLCLASLICLCMLTIGSGNVWGATKVISYEDSDLDTETTIAAANQSSGSAGKVSWSATSATWNNGSSKKRWEWAANSSITFSVSSGYEITQVVIKTSSTTQTISVTSPSGTTITGNNSTNCTISDINASSVTIAIPNAGAYYIKNENVYVTYTESGGGGGTPTCETPTFSPAEGSYIGTQSVTISSTTTGSTIYYTTNGSTPTTSSSSGSAGAASATVSVSNSQTLKAYAVKAGANDSEVATATYTIVSCDHDDFDWDLSTNSYTTGPDEEVTWSGTYATMHNEGTNATNYLGGDANSRTSSRFYSGNALTITPASGVTISHVVFTATTDGYASTLRGSTWTNAAASGSGSYVIVTPTDGTSAFSAAVGGTCGFTNVNVCYSACNTLGSINGSINFETVFEPVSPFVQPPEPRWHNLDPFPDQSRILPHLIYTMYISRDFGYTPFCHFIQKPAFFTHFCPFLLDPFFVNLYCACIVLVLYLYCSLYLFLIQPVLFLLQKIA